MKILHQILLILVIVAAPVSTLFASNISKEEIDSFNDYVKSQSEARGYFYTSSHAGIKSFIGKKILKNGNTQVGLFSPKIEVNLVVQGKEEFDCDLDRASDDGEPQAVGITLYSTVKDKDGILNPKLSCQLIDLRTGTKEAAKELLSEVRGTYPNLKEKIAGPYLVLAMAGREMSAEEFDTFFNSIEVKFEEK